MTTGVAFDPVRELWERFERRDWDGAAELLADDFVAEWPPTAERFRGPAHFIAMNRDHPAPNWHTRMLRLVRNGDQVAAEIEVPSDGAVDFCLGFYDLRGDQIVRAREYWIALTPQAPPDWRSSWTEQM